MNLRRQIGRAALGGAAAWLAGGGAWARAPLVQEVRNGAADRVVILVRPGPGLAMRQDGGTLSVDLPPASNETASEVQGTPGAWVRAASATPGHIQLSLAPGARPRVHVLADRIIIDVDAGAGPLPPGQFRPAVLAAPRPGQPPSPPARAVPRPVPPALTAAAPTSAPLSTLPPAQPPPVQSLFSQLPPPPPMPASPQEQASAVAPSVTLLAEDGTLGGPSILLPAAKLTGAAAFSRNGELRVVLDAPVPLDLSQLKDDQVFGGATLRLLPDGSELRLRLKPGATPRLVRRDSGWQLTLATVPGPLRLITGSAHAGVLSLAAEDAGSVVAVEDDATGGHLLVGTQRGVGQRVVAPHRAAEWALLPSWQGVVVQPRSDRVKLAGKAAGFELLADGPPALALLWPDSLSAVREDGRAMTRRFDFPAQPAPMLHARLAAALRDAATAPLAARGAPRLRVAEAMLACGLDAEAAAVLQVAATDDPSVMRDPAWHGLSAIAAWLSAQAGGAAFPQAGFDAATLGDSDEAALWRGLWGADQTASAAAVGARWRLLLAYPEQLRRRLLPAVAALLARGGQDGPLTELLTSNPDVSLDLTRAGLLQRRGKPDESLRLLDHVAAGNDRLARAQAAELAVEQRLAAGKLTPAAAAGLMDRQIYAWRGGERELRVRLRAAALHADAGAWRPALALLRETDALFPESHEAVHAAETSVVSALLHTDKAARLGALDLVALADDASQVLGAATADAALAPLLADKLLALDLPERAEPILRRLLDRAAGGAAEPELGLRLASLLADKGDGPGALDVLDRSGRQPANQDLAERRALLRASLLAHAGRTAEALSALAAFGDTQAVQAQAGLRESLHDWTGAEQVLRQRADAPGSPEARQTLALRAARDASEAGDMAGLRAMRTAYGPLFAGGANSGLFAVLTAEPVAQVTDLPRAAGELAAMRALPAALTVTAAK